ncbi:hypothetical protein [Methylobacterium oxalidis]|uniref:DUF4126 domain-containing protein n=1 Tax=Methylobacterium oxalidis TaxID=944322 RepID=A0A512JC12_9HYPH|nr:hypothetical protein [Methylobacterium oxalidis]GEP07487.1 hypothetical protein MOX02_55250 [Methylobacterium oxalidis]GJE35445.1 hypothetical protein LDDCCGHA_5663 [Methylobacterium oxalidis]GLS66052.1 hypothetical protein GCM10007888_44340 [Methylobacterium oxalidis]
MQRLGPSFGIGFVAGLRSMTACAALSWAASQRRTRVTWIPDGPGARGLITALALAEMAGDKMPFAPDRRIPPSFAARLAIGAAGGVALAEPRALRRNAALAGMAGAIAGTLLGRAARGGTTRSTSGLARGLTEDVMAAGLAAALVRHAQRDSHDPRDVVT